ncbi:phosphatidylglycerophosphatase A [Maritimibacter sp. 55A14]|uniref:phosphatidylglycerophosphatase A family protein n=1 Tax=Maritimibacter sp. 55A14 TaxID=2174844 RepID=UPI000D60917B|nr:phosphatidylglycerophosphatase A [Maritimibacter sp. 55A14]PWE33145.1 phosphatidylglycerophosphatase A [Maritimibacter sp. 55A14]
MSRLVATFFYVGHLRPAPGTWGSLAALPAAWVLHGLGGFPLLLLATLAVLPLGWWATEAWTRGKADHDPSEVVIDEVAGQWIALLPVSAGAWHTGAEVTQLWPGILGAFLFFRLFDITKWGPVGRADRRADALGVMLDDVIAGIMAAIVVAVLAALAHGVLL